MNSKALLLSISRGLRSLVLTMLAISSPFFLDQEGLGYIEIGLVLLFSSAVSVAFIYLIPRLKIRVSYRIFLTWVLLCFGLLFLVAWPTVPGYLAALGIGGISLSGKDMTPNQPIEQYAISTFSATQKEKNYHFSYYNLLSYIGNTTGSAIFLLLPSIGFRDVFILALLLAIASGIPYFLMKFPEIAPKKEEGKVDPEKRKEVNRLSLLFGIDSFGGGFVNASVLSLWFLAVYSVSIGTTGFIFVIVNILTAISVVISGMLSGRFGLINTMVFTHLISNGFLIVMSVFHVLWVSEMFLFLRQTTSQMDVPPRDSFINTIFDKETRIKTNSQFLAVRNSALIPAPATAGVLVEAFPTMVPAASGVIKSVYDVILYAWFRHYKI